MPDTAQLLTWRPHRRELTNGEVKTMSVRTWVRDNLFSVAKRVTGQTEIQRYFAKASAPRLNIGCGGNRVPGWLNVDRFPPPGVTFMDATKRLPFDDATFEAILCEHMIEHIPKATAIDLVAEMRRVLRPGGLARIVTPDLNWFSRRIIEAVPAGDPDDTYRAFLRDWHHQPEISWCDAVNLCFYEHGHCYIWSIEELRGAMEAAGFVDIVVTRAGRPASPTFSGAEGHPKLMGELPNALEAFGIEGRSPE